MKVAIHARYSSDNQREASIADQFRMCRLHAEKQGWIVVEEYSDHAVSGSPLLRPGIQALISDATRGGFDPILAEAMDRLSRDQEDIAGLFKRMSYSDVKMFTLSEGEVTHLHVGLKGTMNALFLKDLADKTRRGVKKFDANGEPVRGDRTINGKPRSGNGILNNEMYAGKIVWNRQRFVKDPDTGKRQARPNLESDWGIQEAPELRILDDDLWNAVKARQAEMRTERDKSSAVDVGKMNYRRRPKYLFSGLTRYACCGGGLLRDFCDAHRMLDGAQPGLLRQSGEQPPPLLHPSMALQY